MERKRRAGKVLNRKQLTLAVAACFVASTVLANPTGPTVVNGTASILQNGNLLNITNSPNAIINWQSFSIGANEITRFIQQSQASAVLNRVTGAAGVIDPSVILGALQSNGRVFLINPSGILFGAGAQVDVAGLVATSLNLSNADFLANRLKFTEMPGAGSVINQGNITTGPGGGVYLVGPAVTNSGIITTPQGEVILAAGNSVELVNPGTPNLRVEISASDNEAKNLGQIITESGRVGIYAGLINQSGTIRADSAVSEGGRILLRAAKDTTLEAGSVTTANGANGGSVTLQAGDTTLVSGSVEAKGASGQGGSVQMLGTLVGVMGAASIDASGDTGGGSVLVGGDFQGKNPDIQNAFRTHVDSDATIRADAITNGDGGKVVVWSDDTTRAYGTISARGGAQSGNGGFVEVSGKNALDFTASVSASALNGAPGTLLLDPTNIIVATGGGASTTAVDQFADPGATMTIAPATLDAAGTTVVLQASNDITISNAVNLTTANAGFVAQAGSDINVNASITTNSGTIHLEAGSPHQPGGADDKGKITINAAVNSNGGGITLIAGKDQVSSNGGYALNADVNAGSGGINVSLSQAAPFEIGSSGNSQLADDHARRFKTTGALVLGQATSAGTNGLGAGAQTLTVDKFTNDSSSPIVFSSASGSSIQLIAGNGGIELDRNFTTYQTTVITTTGDLDVKVPLVTNNNDLTVSAKELKIQSNGSINTGNGAFFCTVTSGVCPASATGVFWDGGAGTMSWFDALNWSTDLVPGNTKYVRIGSGFGTIQIGTGAAAQARNLIADSPMQLSSGSLTLTDASSFNQTFMLSGGSLLGGGSVTVGGANGSLMWSGGTMDSGGSFSLAAGHTGALTSALTLNRLFTNAGTLTLTSATLGGTGSITNLGTIATAAGPANAVNAALTNPGVLQLSSSLTAANFPVNSGTINLAANNPTFSTGGNSLTNAVTGAISGTGTLDLGGAPSTLTNNGTIRPGGSPGLLVVNGNLVLGSSSIVNFELAGAAARGTDYDAIDVSGNVTLGGTANLIHSGGFTPSALDTFQAIRTTGLLTTVSGAFATVNSPFGFDYTPIYGLTDVNFAFASLLAINEWNTDSSGSWDDPTKWTLGVPIGGQAIRIDRPGSPTVTMNSFVRNILQFENAEILTLDNSTLNISDGSSNTGTLNLNNSTLGGTGTLTNQGTVVLSGGTISAPLENGGLLVAANNATSTISTAPASNLGTIRVNGTGGNTPVLWIASGLTSAGTIDLVADSSGSATLRLTGGTVDVSSGGSVTGSAGSAFNVEGATVNLAIGSGFSVDTTNVSSGVLNISNAVTMANLNLSGGSTSGTGSLAVTSDFNQSGGTFGATFSDLELHKAGAFNVGSFTAANSLRLVATGGITLNGGVSANGSGDAVILAGSTFTNNVGPAALGAPNGRWLIYSTDPASDSRGGLAYDFKQYDAAYSVTTLAQTTGNGFLYTLSPSVTPSLGGTATKVYDGNLTAATGSLIVSPSLGVIDGDSVSLTIGSANYVDKNVGANKQVDATGISVTSATNGSAAVYGYKVNTTPTSGIVGTITPASLTVSGVTANDKVYDATTVATLNVGAAALSGVIAGDSVNFNAGPAAGAFADKNVGSTKPVTASDFAVSGSDAGNYTLSQPAGLTANITPATLTYAANKASRERGDPNPVMDGTVTGFVGGETLGTVTTGILSFASPATQSSVEGQYGINGAGLTALNGNYTFVQAPTNATALTVTAPVNFTWTSLAGGAWETDSNWNKGFAPVDGAVVTIPDLGPAGPSATITYSSATTNVKTLTSFEGLAIAGGALNLGAGAADVSTFQGGAPVTLTGGVLGINSGSTLSASNLALNGGVLRGSGAINGNVSNLAGTVAAGASVGTLTINGNYAQGPAGALTMEIGGPAAGTQYDQLVVTGNVVLDGTLNVALVNSFVPSDGTSFAVIQSGGMVSGSFINTNVPASPLISAQYLAYGVNLLSGPVSGVTVPPNVAETSAQTSAQIIVATTDQSTTAGVTEASSESDTQGKDEKGKNKKTPICSGSAVGGGVRCTSRGCF